MYETALHFLGYDEPEKLASRLKAALDKTNSAIDDTFKAGKVGLWLKLIPSLVLIMFRPIS
jgi:hypothetical protein